MCAACAADDLSMYADKVCQIDVVLEVVLKMRQAGKLSSFSELCLIDGKLPGSSRINHKSDSTLTQAVSLYLH